MSQVITVTASGVLEGLQRKPGQGLDLRVFGKARIERASEIVWDEPSQKWAIKALCLPWAVPYVCYARYAEATGRERPDVPHALGTCGLLLFDEYEDAVRVEVEVLDGLRAKGLLNRGAG